MAYRDELERLTGRLKVLRLELIAEGKTQIAAEVSDAVAACNVFLRQTQPFRGYHAGRE